MPPQQQKKMKEKKKKKKKGQEEKDIIKCISSFSPKMMMMDHLLYHRITLSVSPSRGGK